ncbi:MAG: CoA transferase [Deltaproteobacteria bacterium]|nr:CoA transferase [Deltaproteobacteria bacterium]
MTQGLAGIRVLELADQIAGPYCGKLLVDGGADVVKVEQRSGDSLRGASDALFAYLNAGKRSVVGEIGDAHVDALVAAADLVVTAHGLATDAPPRLDLATLRARHPSLVVTSITPYGTAGPWHDRLATEFTLQAESGSLGMRGVMGREPFQAGGRVSEWGAGTYAAVGSLAAVLRARAGGGGEHLDLSILEVANFVYTNFSETMNRLMNGSAGEPQHAFLAPTVESPSIEPVADGYVGFCTNAKQQFLDFLVLIERPELQEDELLCQFAGRVLRFDEWNAIMRPWLAGKTVAEAIELASALRIPVAPVGNGENLLAHEQLVARGVFVPDASGRFRQPRRPYRIDDEDPPAPARAPRLGEHDGAASFAPRAAGPELHVAGNALPLAGLRVLDLTAWWAGPSAAHVLGCFGAEVIHVESTGHPDGVRMIGGMMAGHYADWWEAAPHFLQTNANKLGVTVDFAAPRGRAIVEDLIRKSDAVFENFTPRVLDGFGLTWERVRELNPRAVMVRMPAFGLTGPWRDNTGFAQTMEQMSGLAWVTGHRDDQPRIPRGPCDPIAGMHGALAFLVAWRASVASGRGHHVESTMVESALNVAAEQVVEWTARGVLLERDGNRSPLAAPQGLYLCAEGQTGESGIAGWLALSVASDAQWHALRTVLGDPEWARDPALDTLAGRHAAHDAIDARLREWTASRERAALVAELRAHGIPASEVANPCRLAQSNPQLASRGYFETPEHAVVGAMPVPGLPFRSEHVRQWARTPAPRIGEHNARVLGGLLGLDADEQRALEADGVVGTRPRGL